MKPLLFFLALGALLTDARSDYPRGCKEFLRSCLGRLPAILDQREMQSIPTNAEELDATCHGFDTGMGCVDNFTANCLGKEREKQKWVENTVAGARATFNMLCGSKDVREQYLKHSRCFRMMSVTDGWNSCAARFISLVRDEMARTNPKHEERILELCCAKHGFLKCVHGSAKHKCGSTSATFLRRVAETLSSVRVESTVCRLVNYTTCSGARRTAGTAHGLGVVGVLGLLAGLVRGTASSPSPSRPRGPLQETCLCGS